MNADLKIADHVAWVTVDRPAKLNAIDEPTQRELEKIWLAVEADSTVRLAILTGSGDRAFCVGSDISAGPSNKSSLDYWAEDRPGGFGGIDLRHSLEIPVLARVNGYALGGGFEMVLGCDLVVAVEHAEFGLPEPRVGRVPLSGGVFHLARHIPYVWAMELLLTGKRIDAHTAARMGIVNEVVPSGQLDNAIERWIEEILACAPLAIRAIKSMVKNTSHLSIPDAVSLRLPSVFANFDSEDGHEGVLAFREKRRPNWVGR